VLRAKQSFGVHFPIGRAMGHGHLFSISMWLPIPHAPLHSCGSIIFVSSGELDSAALYCRNTTAHFNVLTSIHIIYMRYSQNHPSTIAQGSISSLDFKNVHYSP